MTSLRPSPLPNDLSPTALLRQTAWLSRLSRGLVGDAHRAEDVAQDTWVAALQHRGHIRDLPAWLSRVARNFAGRLALREGQRSAREARAARHEAQPSASEVVARAKLQHRVAAAVLALPEPYLTTVVLRFFENLPPRKVAARMEVTVETVRTRLRRAMERLRQELDRACGGRHAWAVGLIPLSGAGHLATLSVITTLIMKAKTLTAAAAVIIASGLTWLVLSSPGALPVANGERVDAGATVSGRGPELDTVVPTGGLFPSGAIETAGAGARRAVAEEGPEPITLRGRCVATGTTSPVAGISVELEARQPARFSARTRIQAFHPPAVETTGPDGRFVLNFEPAEGWSFQLELSGAGIVPIASDSGRLAPGTTIDYGDIEVLRGCRVRGRLVDTAGHPLEGESVILNKGHVRFPRSADVGLVGGEKGADPIRRLEQESSFSVRTSVDGTFEFEAPVPPGSWSAHLWERRQLAEEVAVELAPGEANHWIDMVGEETVDLLAGIVVDDSGAPIAKAYVTFALPSGEEWTLQTGDDGAFRTSRFARDHAGDVQVRAAKRHHEQMTPEQHPWGSTQLQLVLIRGAVVEVVVTDAASGAPVEGYGVRIFRVPENGNVAVSESMLRHIDGHAGGRCQIHGVLRGPTLVMVEPTRDDLEPSWFLPITIEGPGPYEIPVQLHAAVRRDVAVVDSTGAPVVGSTVQLVRSSGNGPITGESKLFRRPLMQVLWMRNAALLLDEAVTDEDGACALASAPSSGLTVRVLGTGHTTAVVSGIELRTGQDPLQIEVAAGATVEGMITPQSLVDELSPSLRLVDIDNVDRHYPTNRKRRVPVGADGAFVLRQVPAGSWRIVLIARGRHPTDLATLQDLRPGEVRQLALDAGHLASGTLRGRVQVNGKPFEGRVALSTVEADPGTVRNHTTYGHADTDENGVFEVRAPQGEYRLMVYWGPVDERRGLLSADIVHVIAGQQSSQDFRLSHRTAEFRLLEADGTTPAAGREMMVLWGNYVWPIARPVTDAVGRLIVDPVPPGPFFLATWPPHLAVRDAQHDYQRENPRNWPDVLITVGPIDPVSAVGGMRDLLLPAR